MSRKWVITGLIALLFVAQGLIRFPSSLIHDAAWYVYVAEGLTQGKKLYTDFVEVNPPLGMWLAVPPVWMAQFTALSAVSSFYIFLFVWTAAVIGLSWRYLSCEKPARRGFLLVAAAAILLFMPGNNFGEREHFMVLMFLPWVLLRLEPSLKPKVWERVLVGTIAGLGIALKPYAIFAPLLVELTLCIQQKNWRRLFAVENLSAIVAVLGYGLAIVIFTPEFFDGIIDLGRRAYLPYYGYPESLVLMDTKWAAIFMALALFAIQDRRVQVLWAAALGFLISYFLQNKGFTYHILPATVFALLACAATVQAEFATSRLKLLATSVMAIAAAAFLVSEPQAYLPNREVSARIEVLRTADTHSVFIASNHFFHAFPYVVEQHLKWASRQPTQWLAPYVADHWKPGETTHDPIVAKALNWTIEDLSTLQPDIVAIDNSDAQRNLLGGFEFLKFWNEDPRFATLWQNYRLASSDGDILIYLRQK